ncbi:MAPEG family protein [Phenylobacterium sp.]|uniref:MAPEG family protein n=1 Tax=Phenylobacterium sp. TaxID=1871053 RepID=UPI00261CA0FE|nr:MAPEG family protein [Phenylobacterium sp.]
MTITTGAVLSGAVTVVALLVTFWMGLRVGLLRHRHGIEAPAVSGHPDFERAYRVQMNTMEQLVLFLPLLWLSTLFLRSFTWAPAAVGLVWIAGRLVYSSGYMAAPERRGTGFQIGMLASLALLILTLVGLAQAWGVRGS